MIWLSFFYPNYNSYTNIRVLDYQSMKNTIKGKLTMDSLESNGQTVGQNQECEQMCCNDLQAESKYPSMWRPRVENLRDEPKCSLCNKNLDKKDINVGICIDCYKECTNCGKVITEEDNDKDYEYCNDCYEVCHITEDVEDYSNDLD